jgi:UDP-glucose 4-epimerase
MKALVYGGNGFIGSHLVDALIIAGHMVRVLDRFEERYRPPRPGVDYCVVASTDRFQIAEALKDIDIVYHLASTDVPSTSNLDPIADIEGNLIGTVHLLNQMVQAGVKRILFLSSGGTVYGNTDLTAISEEHPLKPICSYAVVKLAIENYLNMYKELYGLSPIILRPSNAYGPRQGHRGTQGLIFSLLSKAKAQEPLIVWGDGSVVRDYVYVEDLVRLCSLAGSSDLTGTFNAGSGYGYSVSEVINMTLKTLGVKLTVAFQGGRPFDVRKVILDCSKAEKVFGWKASTSLSEGILKTWSWIQSGEMFGR